MRFSGPSGPQQRQNQTAVGIGLVILTFFTAFAVSQAFPWTRNGNGADNLAKMNAKVGARQLQGAPWGLPWGIFGGGQSASSINPAQPAMTTPLPAAAPAVPNNQPQGPLGGAVQIIPGALASLTLAVGGATVGNVLPTILNAVPPLLQPGGPPSLPTAAPIEQVGQSPANGGLLTPVQSLVNTNIGVGGNIGSPLSLSGINDVLNPLASPVGGGISVSQVTEAINNGVPVINGLPTVNGLSAAVGVITAAPGNPTSVLPISNVIPSSLLVSSLNGVLDPVSVVLPPSAPSGDFGGLNAPQLPADLTDAVPSLIRSLINAVSRDTASASTAGGALSQASISSASAVYFPCTMVEFTNRTPAFIFTTCSTGASAAAPQTAASSVSSPVAAPVLSAPVGAVSSFLLSGAPTSPLLSAGGGTANLPAASQVSAFITSGSTLVGTLQPSLAAAAPTGGINNNSPLNSSPIQAGAGSQGNSAKFQTPNTAGQLQPPAQISNATSGPASVIHPPAGATQSSSQPNGSTAASPPPAPAVSPQTTINIAAGPPASQSRFASSNSKNSLSSSPTQSGGSIFGVDNGQGSSPGTPVIPISDCPAVVQCPACPVSSANPSSGSCPCPGRGYSCSECLNGWFCPPQETPMQPAPCGMGWPCYHCKGGWYCAPGGNSMASGDANSPTAVVITTVTAFIVPQPTATGNGVPGGNGGGNGNEGSVNGSSNGVGNNGGSGNVVSTPCTTAGGGQPTNKAGSGSSTGLGNNSPTDPNNDSGNASGDSDAGNNGGSPGNDGPAEVGSWKAASTPCTTASNAQPTNITSSGNDNGSHISSGSPNNGSGNIPGNGQGIPDAGNPSSGYGGSAASPTTGNPNSGSGTSSGAGSGTPNGNGTPGSTGPSIPAVGSNGDTGPGDPNAGSGSGSPSNAAPKAAPEVSGWTHLGCFKDSPIRTLDCDLSNYFAGSMSNEKCISYCASKGFRLAGTEYGKECWCGNAFQLAERIPEEQCNEVCDGRSTDVCGGDWAVTVYSASGQALSVPSDDDTSNDIGNSTGNLGDFGNTVGPGSPSPPSPAGLPAPSAKPLPQSQPSPAPAGSPQPALSPPLPLNPPPQRQIDVASLIQSIINALPKGSPEGGYASGLGARDSGTSGNSGSAASGDTSVPDTGAGSAPMLGPGPVLPTDGLSGYGSQKRDVAGRSVKRSSIIGRRVVAKFNGIKCGDETGGYDEDSLVERA
ncbi:WSC domain-containing protein [Colletotrichum incanum]|nr:WSC domain-containing protein [Colletotrichum incanum]